ncbi:ABC transporter permease subunit [Ancylobacter defluvii]|uniref:ABC transmembrane type-1 domain-containing protein n=1 Tax=Ancylobacter defluvii TaxID=1282440 RepID=A0A9W6JXH5_9HYPH|nr:ABC transporter permease subunit [Ancylobacter defluvii]MBS7586001.1 ABC transporter permease subunit [Ancylobacter defluvii]GLK84381.1 hypothetical protein GCM10017653_24510 [Ancylobacter defluvii]
MGARLLPPPHAVVANAFGNLFSSAWLPGIGLPRGGYLPHILFTAANVLIGGGAGALIGIASGLASAGSRTVAEALDPLMSLLGTIPIVIMAPFFLMWFGLSGLAQIALVTLYTATVLHLFALRGVRNLPPAFMDYAATLGPRRCSASFPCDCRARCQRSSEGCASLSRRLGGSPPSPRCSAASTAPGAS